MAYPESQVTDVEVQMKRGSEETAVGKLAEIKFPLCEGCLAKYSALIPCEAFVCD